MSPLLIIRKWWKFKKWTHTIKNYFILVRNDLFNKVRISDLSDSEKRIYNWAIYNDFINMIDTKCLEYLKNNKSEFYLEKILKSRKQQYEFIFKYWKKIDPTINRFFLEKNITFIPEFETSNKKITNDKR